MNWLLVCGKENLALEEELSKSSQSALDKYNFKPQSLAYITKLDRSIDLNAGANEVDALVVEKLRALCKFWDVDTSLEQVSSHRKFIGPFIVKGKKLLFSVVRVILKAPLAKQRNFNAQVLELLVDLAKNQTKTSVSNSQSDNDRIK